VDGTDETTNRITDQEILPVSVIIFLVQSVTNNQTLQSFVSRTATMSWSRSTIKAPANSSAFVAVSIEIGGRSGLLKTSWKFWPTRGTQTSDKTVRLVLKDSACRGVTIERAPMPAENRRATYLFRQQNLKDHADWPK